MVQKRPTALPALGPNGLSLTLDGITNNLLKQPPKEQAGGNVKVFCRFRPLNTREKNLGEKSNGVCEFLNDYTIEVPGTMGKQKYTFDRIFDSDSQQKHVFDDAIEPVVQSVMEGFNGTVLAYG